MKLQSVGYSAKNVTISPYANVGQKPEHSGFSPNQVADYWGSAQGKTGAELLGALHSIVSNGHRDIGYREARDGMFQTVFDHSRNNHIEDIYSNRTGEGIDGRRSAYEAGFNAEHTWPQSKGATGIAQSDLHQLMPADTKINEIRGSLPFGEVIEPTWSSDEYSRPSVSGALYGAAYLSTPVLRLGAFGGSGKTSLKGLDSSGNEVFEPPHQMKGDIARALLYFYVRYSKSPTSRFTLENFRIELPSLLKWHAMDPVDDFERQRNNDVQALQNNRNPFIDHPEWVEMVDFK